MNLGEHLRAGTSLYDSPAHWFDAEVERAPTFSIRQFQKRINRAIGTANGAPIIRLSWAPDVAHWRIRETEAGWERKYVCFEDNLDGIGRIQISPPRYVLEQRIEPAQYLPHWNKKRFGAAPVDGIYEFLCYIADHEEENACCGKARKLYQKGKLPRAYCFGRFRFPGDDTIELLQYAKRELDSKRTADPHQPLSEHDIADALREGREIEAAMEDARRDDLNERFDNEFAIFGHRLETDDPSVLTHGRYHDVGASWRKSKGGILLPQ